MVLFTCGPLGTWAAAALAALPDLDLMLVTAPLHQGRRSLGDKLRDTRRDFGWRGVARLALARVRRGVPGGGAEEMSRLVAERCPRVGHLRVADLHDETTLAAVRRLAPDLGVVVATYRLRPELFTIPRLGTLNLHFGLAPEYRGSSPGFWELYDGTPESGVTVHWVNEALDAGDILRQERYPLDIAPPGDPLAYLDRYWRGVLRPNGVRLLAEAVDALRRGPLPAVLQDPARARTRRRATWRDKLELRRRVRAR